MSRLLTQRILCRCPPRRTWPVSASTAKTRPKTRCRNDAGRRGLHSQATLRSSSTSATRRDDRGAVLHNFYISSCSWRVRIALHLKNIPFQYEAVNLLKGAVAKLNPLMREIPVLEIDDVSLTQSLAIIEYLDETTPAAPRLIPSDPLRAYRVRQISHIILAGVQPFQSVGTVRRITRGGLDKEEWLHHYLPRGLGACEALVEETHAQQQGDATPLFCAGHDVTIADLFAIPQLAHARRYGVDTRKLFPRLTAVEHACAELPAFAKATPEVQPDCPDDYVAR